MPDWTWIVLWVVAITVFLLFSFVIMFGAPFLPTRPVQVSVAMELLDLKKGQTLLELGSGDGRLLIAAAQQGVYAIGYELNPLLVVYSWLRTRKYRKYVRIIWGNYWNKPLPKADAIFTFLLNKFMTKLDNKITQESNKPIKLASFAFKIPGKPITKEEHGVFLYRYD